MSYWVIISQSEVAQIKILRLIFQDECHLSRNISKFYSNITDQVKLKKIIILKIIQEECHSSKGWIKSYIEEDPHLKPLILGCWIRRKILHSGQKHIFSSLLRLRGKNLAITPVRLYLLVQSRNILLVGATVLAREQDSWVLSTKNLEAEVISQEKDKN